MENVDLLRPLIIDGLFSAKVTKEDKDFKAWVSSGKFLVRNVHSPKNVDIEVTDEYAFTQMLAYDCCRMASASFETMENIHKNNRLNKSFGWHAIKCYYAAFFSAHSIMRCFGFSCSQLEKGHAVLLNEYAGALNIEKSLQEEGGFFAARYSSQGRILALHRMKNSHEDTWGNFTSCLREISQTVLTVTGLTQKKQIISAQLSDLLHDLSDGGRLSKGSHLSQFRNAINYRLEYQAWHPYGKASIKSEDVIALIANWRSPHDRRQGWKKAPEAHKFFSTCLEVIRLNYQLMNLIMKNSSNNKNLFERWLKRLYYSKA